MYVCVRMMTRDRAARFATMLDALWWPYRRYVSMYVSMYVCMCVCVITDYVARFATMSGSLW